MNQKSVYLFDFQRFVEELRENENKQDIIETYEKNFGSLKDKDYSDLPFYKNYLVKFGIDEDLKQKIEVPEDLVDDFDYDLLLKLVLGSFSSEYQFIFEDDTDSVKLFISVKSEGQSITKRLGELWSFQIYRLFEIYMEEQMNLANIMEESEEDGECVGMERKMHFEMFKKELARLEEYRNSKESRTELIEELNQLNADID